MNGRTAATARPSVRATDAATVSLRRRMALAVTRRFAGTGHAVVAPMALPTAIDNPGAPESDCLALDQRVRETGEW